MSDQVICIEGDNGKFEGITDADPAVKGQIYTVRRYFSDYCGGGPAYFLWEIRGGTTGDGLECALAAEAFVPIKDSSLDIFRELAKPVLEDA